MLSFHVPRFNMKMLVARGRGFQNKLISFGIAFLLGLLLTYYLFISRNGQHRHQNLEEFSENDGALRQLQQRLMYQENIWPEDKGIFHPDKHYSFFRVPCLMHIQGVLYAFCEGRYKSVQDASHMNIVLRRGQVKDTGLVVWDDLLEVVSVPGYRTMNPTAVYDSSQGKVFLLFIGAPHDASERGMWENRQNLFSIFVVESTDEGGTWSEPRNITDMVLGDRAKIVSSAVAGPGHGIQLRTGRLVVPAYYYRLHDNYKSDPEMRLFDNVGHSTVIYSDNGGRTWNMGGEFDAFNSTGQLISTCECQVVEHVSTVGVSTLYLNARVYSRLEHSRVMAKSFDGGVTWSGVSSLNDLHQPTKGCMGGFVSIPQTDDKDPLMVFSNPKNYEMRKTLYLTYSTDMMSTWSSKYTVYAGPSGYSDLAEVKLDSGGEQYIAVLYEKGISDYTDNGIVFQLIPLRLLQRFNLEAMNYDDDRPVNVVTTKITS